MQRLLPDPMAPPRRRLVAALLALVACACAAREAEPPRFPKANLLLVSLDTLRADHVGCYGAGRARTPHLDRLAAEGVRFAQAIAATNHTAPSHATMLTGTSPAVHGLVNSETGRPRKIPRSIPTLAERLRKEGYATAADTGAGYVRKEFDFDRGFDTFHAEFTGIVPKVEKALRWFDQLAPDRPGFYFLHTYQVHAPYLPPEDDLERLCAAHGGSVLPERLRRIFALPLEQRLPKGHGMLLADAQDLSETDVECLRALYRETVEVADRELGRILDGLRERGRLERTLVVVTSDHGEEFGEHGGFQHESVFEEILHVPLIVRFPGGAHAGSVVEAGFGAVRLLPTILDWLALPEPTGIDGASGAAWVVAEPSRETVVFANLDKKRKLLLSVARTRFLKVLRGRSAENGFRPLRAFDLAADPREVSPRDPEALPGASDLVEAIRAQERIWTVFQELHAGSAAEGELTEELAAELEALGYLK